MGGPACLAGEQELADVEAFFDLIESCETGGDLTDFEALGRRMEDLYARPDPAAGSKLQILTMHKAKGLEFDTVILPGLGRSRRNDDPKLLSWADSRPAFCWHRCGNAVSPTIRSPRTSPASSPPRRTSRNRACSM